MDIHRYIRYCLGLVLTTVLVMHSSGVYTIPFINALESRAYDARMRLAPVPSDNLQVIIVDVDEKSLEIIGHWPWHRHILARIVDNLFDHYQIKSLGFDVVFAEADEDASEALLHSMASGPLKDASTFQAEYQKALSKLKRDEIFAASLANRRTVTGFIFGSSTNKGLLPAPVAILNHESDTGLPLVQADGYTANLAILQMNAHGGGFFDNPLIDADGVYRRVPLLQQHKGRLYESLALALSRATLNKPAPELVVSSESGDDDSLLLQWLKIGDIIIPVDEHATVLIPYIGPQRSFNYISASDILDKRADIGSLRGKTVLFGTSAAGLYDLRTTPIETAFPGVEIHASIVQGIIDQTIMHMPGYARGIELLTLLFIGIFFTFLFPRLPPGSCLLVSLLALVILTGGNMLIWNQLHMVLPVASPTLLVAVLFILNATYGYFSETRVRRKLAHLFGQYVPPELVDEMTRNMREIDLDGELREMSVLFADARNFTAISEDMTPKALTQLINAFLTPLTEEVLGQRGTIDKYTGDGVMAFWGAPLEDSRHAEHALYAAINMIKRIDELKPVFRSRGWPEISIGIGINSGEMNVGNKGSAFRVDYTVVGDAVNLGSRLESLTRVYGVDIIAGEDTRRLAHGFAFRELDRVRVKGKDKPVVIYELAGPRESIDQSQAANLAHYHHALELYRERRWDDAEQELFSLSQSDPQRRIYQIYLDRIMHFREQPPPDGWDGSFTYTST